MYPVLVHTHSGLRWFVLLLLIYVIFNAFKKWKSGETFSMSDARTSLYTLIIVHLQLILGVVLYFISTKVDFTVEGFMKIPLFRFFMVEHVLLMVLAIILITVGYSRAKNLVPDVKKFKTLFWFYLSGLILILLGIPWPFRGLGTGWF